MMPSRFSFWRTAKLAEARKAATEGLAVPKAEVDDRAKLYRNLASAHLLDPANKVPSGVSPQALNLANAELDKAVSKRELKEQRSGKDTAQFWRIFSGDKSRRCN